ncbi:unnamed protein product [Soboliphyme baturini]|uniref:VIR_N domain-containing protein n=1 Tax=Soboliphyme baturini TaxID=241478 RepID=A0A183IWR4_9BILA|nr:unnamed protein product [Soboliphyme baturini]
MVNFIDGQAIIREIWIIPGGISSSSDEVTSKLSVTSPGSFLLEFFVNNLGRPKTCTFERLGSLECHGDCESRFCPSLLLRTDKLLIKGTYATVTVAVIGEVWRNEGAASCSPSTVSKLAGDVVPTPAHKMAIAGVPLSSPASSSTQKVTTALPSSWSSPVIQLGTVIAPFDPRVPPPVIPAAQTGPPIAIVPSQSSYPPQIQQISSVSCGTILLPPAFDPTRPPPVFIKKVGLRSERAPHTGTQKLLNKKPAQLKPSSKHLTEGKPIQTVSTVKPVASLLVGHQQNLTFRATIDSADEDYEASEDSQDKFDIENISEDEDGFEFEGLDWEVV